MNVSRVHSPAGRSSDRDDRILAFTRLLAAIIVPFLVIASVLLCFFAESTDELFAWTIRPPFTAMLLGCAYIGGIFYFVTVTRARRWHRIWTGMPAVVVFASLAGIATFLHFDRFHHGHVSFLAWTVLYVTTPLLVLVALVLNARRDPGGPDVPDAVIPFGARLGIGLCGAAAVVVGLALFVSPESFMADWAWPLTPLTARIVAAVLILPGMVDVLLLVDRRWSSFRTIFSAQLVGIAAIAVSLAVRAGDLDWRRPVTIAFVAALAAAAVAYATLAFAMERRVRAVAG